MSPDRLTGKGRTLGLPQLNLRHSGDRDSKHLAWTNPCRHFVRRGTPARHDSP